MPYQHRMPLWMQDAARDAMVTVGATHGQSRAPSWLALGPVRHMDAIDDLYRDAEKLAALFAGCPQDQWGAAAQGGMAVGWWND